MGQRASTPVSTQVEEHKHENAFRTSQQTHPIFSLLELRRSKRCGACAATAYGGCPATRPAAPQESQAPLPAPSPRPVCASGPPAVASQLPPVRRQPCRGPASGRSRPRATSCSCRGCSSEETASTTSPLRATGGPAGSVERTARERVWSIQGAAPNPPSRSAAWSCTACSERPLALERREDAAEAGGVPHIRWPVDGLT